LDKARRSVDGRDFPEMVIGAVLNVVILGIVSLNGVISIPIRDAGLTPYY
jgi:hypothetical protein